MSKRDMEDILDTLDPEFIARNVHWLEKISRTITDLDFVLDSLTVEDRLNIAAIRAISLNEYPNLVISNHETFVDHFIQGIIIGGLFEGSAYPTDPLLMRYVTGSNLMPGPLDRILKSFGSIKAYRDKKGVMALYRAVKKRLKEDPKSPPWLAAEGGRSIDGLTRELLKLLIGPIFGFEEAYITLLSISWENHPDKYAKSLTQRIKGIPIPGENLDSKLLSILGKAVKGIKGFAYLANELGNYMAYSRVHDVAKCVVTVHNPIYLPNLKKQAPDIDQARVLLRDRIISGYKLFLENLRDYAVCRIVGNGIPIGDLERETESFAPVLAEILDELPKELFVDIPEDTDRAVSRILDSLSDSNYRTRIAQRFTRLVTPPHTQYGANRVQEIIDHHKS